MNLNIDSKNTIQDNSINNIKMETDSISIISDFDVSSNDIDKESNQINETNMAIEHSISACSDRGEPNNDETNQIVPVEKDEGSLKNISKIFVFGIAIVGLTVLFVIPWTSIPRENTIIYPHFYWTLTANILLLGSITWLLTAAADLLNLTIWTKERSLMSFKIFLKMFISYMITWMVLYILGYVIWCNYLGYNPPLPFQIYLTQVTWILFMMELWIILPGELISKKEFRRKILFYYVHFFWWSIVVPNSTLFLSYLFGNLPSELQFLVAFFVAVFREVDKRVRSKIVEKMMGKLDEPARALISITISAQYGFLRDKPRQ